MELLRRLFKRLRLWPTRRSSTSTTHKKLNIWTPSASSPVFGQGDDIGGDGEKFKNSFSTSSFKIQSENKKKNCSTWVGLEGQTSKLKSTPFAFDLSSQDDTVSTSSSEPFGDVHDGRGRRDDDLQISGSPVPLESLDSEETERRKSIIDVLSKFKIINPETAMDLSRDPVNMINDCSNTSFILVNNLLYLEHHQVLGLSTCFSDYLNYRCHDGNNLVVGPIKFFLYN